MELGSNLFSYAQPPIDSLRNLLNHHIQQDTTRVNLLNNLGYLYWVVNSGKSEELGQKALTLANQLKFTKGVAFSYRIIGVSHWARGNYEMALSYLFQAAENYRAVSDELGIANSEMNMGTVFQEKLSYERALDYYFNSLKVFEKLGNLSRVTAVCNYIGDVYYKLGKHQEANTYFERALAINDEINFPYGISEGYYRLAVLAYDKGELEKALSYDLKAIAIKETINDNDGLAKSLKNVGNIYMRKKQYKKAKPYLFRGVEIARKIGAKQWLRDLYLGLKDIAIATQNYPDALHYYEKYTTMKDSILNEENAMRFADLQTQMETKEKEKQIQLKKQQITLLEQEAKLDKILKNSLLFGLIFIISIAYLLISRQQIKLKKKREIIEKNKELYQSRQALADIELENAKLKEKKLEQELEYKSKELTSYAINFIQKNELMEELKENIKQIKKFSNSEVSHKLNSLNRLVDNTLNVDKDWEDFRLHFEQVHYNFFKLLKEHCPELSNAELKLCALIKLNMNMKEAASILGISPESVKTARYRLRKKFHLTNGENLADFIMRIEDTAVYS